MYPAPRYAIFSRPTMFGVDAHVMVALTPYLVLSRSVQLNRKKDIMSPVRVRQRSNIVNIVPSAVATAGVVSKTLLVGIAAASALRAATAFGFGSALSPATAIMASTAGREPSRASNVSRRRAATMTEKPSQVFVAGATGRLGQRVVR